MEDLNNVPSSGTYGAAINEVNANFSLVVNAINSLEYATTKSKGIYNNGFTPNTTTLPNSVSGDWCMVLGTGNTFPARIWTFNGTTWAQGGQWNPDGINLNDYATTSALNTAVANSLLQATARMGYCEATISNTTIEATLQGYLLPSSPPTGGGNVRIKMPSKASVSGIYTLNINSTGAKEIMYNGLAVSPTNTWDIDEVVVVYYTNNKYWAKTDGGVKMDTYPTENSKKAVSSGGVYSTTPSISESSDGDFEIADELGNVILRLKNGHVKTKYFDSRDIDNIGFSQIDEDFKISDENGYDIVAFSGGHVKTKYFDSRDINVNIYKPYTDGLIIFDLPDVECSPLGSTNVINKIDVTEDPDANISIKKDAYGCLYLPKTYSQKGEQTKLILFATGGHTFLDREHGWMPSSPGWVNNTIKDLTNRGYAVFGASIPGVTYDTWVSMGNYGVPMGLPDIMESSYRAYLYIVGNYNVCKQIYIWGCSEGGLLALNWGIIHRDIVAAIAHCAGCVSSYSEWISYGSWKTLRKRMANVLDFTDKSGDLIVSSYEHDKADVFDPYTRLLNINNAFYIYGWNTPIHFFWGTSDDVLTTDSIIGEKSNYNVNFHRAIINSGGISFFKWYKGYNHSDVAMGDEEIVREDVINWFNHF